MKYSFYAILLFIALTMASCFEIIEDVTVHKNGSGTYKFIVNLSQSKNQIDKIRTQDSILHFKVPTTAMADANYIYHLSCDFKNVTSLNTAILSIWKTYDKKAPAAFSLYTYENNVFKRNTTVTELDHITQLAGPQERELLQKANYTVICRFDTTIAVSNTMNYSLSASKKATLYKKDVWSTIADKGISNNIITITQ
jgi:hypothetical protein